MASLTFERPNSGAPRLWYEAAGRPPMLVAPLSRHRRKWGDLYDCGPAGAGCHLLAATLLNQCGVPAAAATFFAPYFVQQHLQGREDSLIRWDVLVLNRVVRDLVEAYEDEWAAYSLGEVGVRDAR